MAKIARRANMAKIARRANIAKIARRAKSERMAKTARRGKIAKIASMSKIVRRAKFPIRALALRRNRSVTALLHLVHNNEDADNRAHQPVRLEIGPIILPGSVLWDVCIQNTTWTKSFIVNNATIQRLLIFVPS
jgi:hypothetical protein